MMYLTMAAELGRGRVPMAEEEESVVGRTHLAASALKPGLGENSTTSATSHCSRSGCQHWSGCVHPQHVAGEGLVRVA